MQIIKRNGDTTTISTVDLFAGIGGLVSDIIEEAIDSIEDLYKKVLAAIIKGFETMLGFDKADIVLISATHYTLVLDDTYALKHIVHAFLEHSGLTRMIYLVTRFHRGNTDDAKLSLAM